MDLHGILTEMHKEHAAITDSIEALERFASVAQGRRGRRPKWVAEALRRAGISDWKSSGGAAGASGAVLMEMKEDE